MMQQVIRLFWQTFIRKLYLPKPLAVPNQGWTLIEMAVISVIVGILASTTIPSMVGLMAKNSLESSMSQVKGAIQEAQRSAIKNGKSCTVTIDTIAKTVTGSPVGCITSPVTLNSDTTVTTSPPPSPSTTTAFLFSYKGNPNNSTNDFTGLTMILGSTKTSTQRCLVISAGIGIMRSGTYSGTTCTSSL
jgi:Tfp pilus assembly protein FimT